MWLFYVAILEKATITLLSDRWHTRFAHTDAITPSLVARARHRDHPRRRHPSSLGCVHASRHLRDERASRVARAHAGLRMAADLPSVARLSSVVGLVILAHLGAASAPPAREVAHPALQDQRAGADRRAVVAAGRVAVAADCSTGCRNAPRATTRSCSSRPSALMSGFFIAWCCIAVGMWINARR